MVVGVVQGVNPDGTKLGKAASSPSILGFPLTDWKRFVPRFPTYRASKTEPALSSLCRPKDHSCVFWGPKFGVMLVSLKVRGSNTPRTKADAKSARTFGPVGFASSWCVPTGSAPAAVD